MALTSNFTKYAIIVAGGSGSRMGNNTPKQFLLLNNIPVIIHTLNRFIEFDKNIKIIVVIHPDFKIELEKILKQFQFNYPLQIIDGGETRYHSVKNGLNCIKEDGVVGIHDAARPLVSIETINRTYNTAFEKGNAIPVITVSESLRLVEKGTNKSVDRNHYKIIQTPQCFKITLIQKAFEQSYTPLFTDDATVLEHDGHDINLVEGNPENIKITIPTDLKIAETFIQNYVNTNNE